VLEISLQTMSVETIAPDLTEHQFAAPLPEEGPFLLGAARVLSSYNLALARNEVKIELPGAEDPMQVAAQAEETAWYRWDRHLAAAAQHAGQDRPWLPRMLEIAGRLATRERRERPLDDPTPTIDLRESVEKHIASEMSPPPMHIEIVEASCLLANIRETQRLAAQRDFSTLELLVLCEAFAHRLENTRNLAERREAEWIGRGMGLLAPAHVTFDLKSIK
jgi:hypothetical protein